MQSVKVTVATKTREPEAYVRTPGRLCAEFGRSVMRSVTGVVIITGCVFGVVRPALSQSYNVTVDKPRQSMSFTGAIPGEAQSTVVPPGLKSQCQAGRFIVTNDARRPTDGGSVVWRDLDGAGTTFTQTSFDSIPLDTSKIAFKTNDHDIITMPNGDVVLVWGMHFATPLSPKPGWFDITFKGTFGPGVRRGVMAWRSTDCGQSFNYVGQVDPAATADGSCAFPQWSKDSNGNFIKNPPYSNGGVDGQLIKLDPATSKIYLMFQCVGQKQDPTKQSFTLTSERLNKTMVLMSPDEGTTWNMLGWLNTATWRFGVVPLPQGGLAFAASNILSFGTKLGNGTYQFDSSGTPTPTGKWGWDNFDGSGVKTLVGANIFGHTIVTRVPRDRNGILLSFPDTLQQNAKPANGYRLFFYDRSKNQYAEADPIVPVAKNPDSFTMHLTAVDLGVGPILLYWYDLNVATRRGTVRGRLVTGMGEYSDDFAIFGSSARSISMVSPFRLAESFDLGTGSYWYGDYKTAGGYTQGIRRRALAPILSVQQQTYNYFPMWVEPDKTVRYVRVSAEAVASRSSNSAIRIEPRMMEWRPAPPPVELMRRRWTPAELRDILDYSQRAIAP